MAMIQIKFKIPKSRLFKDEAKQAWAWLSTIKCYFAALGFDKDKQVYSVHICNIFSALMQ